MTERPPVPEPNEREPIVVGDQSVSADQLTHWEAIFRRMRAFRTDPLEELQKHVAIMFIDYLWMRGEALRLGIQVPGAELDALVEERIRNEYADEGALAAYLEESGQTMDDLRFRVRMARYSEVVRHHVTKDATSDDDKRQRIDSFMERYSAYWSARTRCRDPYFLPDRCLPGDGTEHQPTNTAPPSRRSRLFRRR